jgi:hypothetical protein
VISNLELSLAVLVVMLSLTIWLVQKRASAQATIREERHAIEMICMRETMGEMKEVLDLHRDELARTADALDFERDKHAKTRKEFEELSAKFVVLVARHIQTAGDAADCQAQSQYWKSKAKMLWTESQKQEAAKQKEDNRDLGFTLFETVFSFFTPCRKPRTL